MDQATTAAPPSHAGRSRVARVRGSHGGAPSGHARTRARARASASHGKNTGQLGERRHRRTARSWRG
ncbi:hypothetical protein CZ771_08845 [Actinomycetales bacterium JB111]|nr:hypothetical protein CZ771_08845 [Actinomycetales bacterium JB111]